MSPDIRYRYLQVAEHVRESIRAGQFRPGDKLPGYRALAERFGTAPGTVIQALNVLVDEGTLQTTPGVGRFVLRTPAEADAQSPVTRAEFDELRRRVEKLEARNHVADGAATGT